MPAHKIPLVKRLASALRIEGECWVWTKAKDHDGYAVIKIKKRMVRVSRLIFKLYNRRDVSPGMLACHTCDNPPCFRPSHVFEGTHLDNQSDKRLKGRSARGDHHGQRTHPERNFKRRQVTCKSGHPYTPETTGRGKRGYRTCLICIKVWRQRAKDKLHQRREEGKCQRG